MEKSAEKQDHQFRGGDLDHFSIGIHSLQNFFSNFCLLGLGLFQNHHMKGDKNLISNLSFKGYIYV
jgi:hypothetical protein